MPRPGFSFRRRLFLLLLLVSIVPALAIGLLSMRFVDRSVDRWSNRGFGRTLQASQRLADSLAAWDGERLEADPELTEAMANLDVGVGNFHRLDLIAPLQKRVLAIEIAILVLVLLATALVLARIAGNRLTHPIGLLVKGTERVRAGDLDHRVPAEGVAEMERLIAAWNEMTAGLRENRVKLRRYERTAAWGEAARRVAHEIKNPLTPIELSLHRIRGRLPGLEPALREPIEESTRAMLEELTKLKRLADEFSAFSRLPSPRASVCDVASLLQEIASLHAREGIEFVLEIPDALPPVRLDGALVRIAVGNLVKNAQEAMEGRGTVRLAAGAGERRLFIEVTDSGPGIAAADRMKVFEPDYTTKPQGTGIGLALVERIVLDQGGSVSLSEAPEGGARFRLEFPIDG